MSKESYRAEIAPKLHPVVNIIFAVLVVIWSAVFIPVRNESGRRYNITGMYLGHNAIKSQYLIAACIIMVALILLRLYIHIALVQAPKQCTLTLNENGISGMKKTLFGSKSVELPFENITSIAVKNGIADKLVGGKTVAVASATGFIKFLGVQNAQEFTERTLEELRRFKAQVKSGASAAPAGDDAAQLAKLKSLLDSGVLTQAEYDAKKAEILARM